MKEFFFDRNEFRLTHRLNHLFVEIKRFKTRKELAASPLYASHGAEIERVLGGVEWKNSYNRPEAKPVIRVVSWNIERGRNLEGILHFLKHDERLAGADIILLTETDIGMGRSGNRNIPAEIAAALEMNYCYANSFLVLSKGDEGEQEHTVENTLSLHGSTILSRFKMLSYKTVTLPVIRDDFATPERNLGNRRTLICKIQIGESVYNFSVVHLEVKSSPYQRAKQMLAVLKEMSSSGVSGQLVGGDFNTHTSNLQNKFSFFRSFVYRVLLFNLEEMLSHFIRPQVSFDKPLFDLLASYGFNFVDFNDLPKGTFYYDSNNVTMQIKGQKWVPKRIYQWGKELLKPWDGLVPARMDWLAGKKFRVAQKWRGESTAPGIIERPEWKGQPVSDHNPLVVELEMPGRPPTSPELI